MRGVRLLTVIRAMRRLPAIVTTHYCLIVLACISLAFDYAGAVDVLWLVGLMALTLPWSLVSLWFAWELLHGAGLWLFTLMYLVFAGVNAVILYHVTAALGGRTKGAA